MARPSHNEVTTCDLSMVENILIVSAHEKYFLAPAVSILLSITFLNVFKKSKEKFIKLNQYVNRSCSHTGGNTRLLVLGSIFGGNYLSS